LVGIIQLLHSFYRVRDATSTSTPMARRSVNQHSISGYPIDVAVNPRTLHHATPAAIISAEDYAPAEPCTAVLQLTSLHPFLHLPSSRLTAAVAACSLFTLKSPEQAGHNTGYNHASTGQ